MIQKWWVHFVKRETLIWLMWLIKGHGVLVIKNWLIWLIGIRCIDYRLDIVWREWMLDYGSWFCRKRMLIERISLIRLLVRHCLNLRMEMKLLILFKLSLLLDCLMILLVFLKELFCITVSLPKLRNYKTFWFWLVLEVTLQKWWIMWKDLIIMMVQK
jgi:hypothetical protein